MIEDDNLSQLNQQTSTQNSSEQQNLNMEDSQIYSKKQKLSKILIIIGIIGYVLTGISLLFAIYFLIGSITHSNAAEDQPHGLDGLGFILSVGQTIFFGLVSTAIFVPGMSIKYKLEKGNLLQQNKTEKTKLKRIKLKIIIPVMASLVIVSLVVCWWMYIRHISHRDFIQSQAQLKQLQESLQPTPITITNAESLLGSCAVHQFYSPPLPGMVEGNENPDKSSTGVLITTLNNAPWRITASSKLTTQLLPVAQAAQVKCGAGLPFINSDN